MSLPNPNQLFDWSKFKWYILHVAFTKPRNGQKMCIVTDECEHFERGGLRHVFTHIYIFPCFKHKPSFFGCFFADIFLIELHYSTMNLKLSKNLNSER